MNICWADDFNCENYIYFSRSYQELFARIYHSELRYLKINYQRKLFYSFNFEKLKNNYKHFFIWIWWICRGRDKFLGIAN